MQGKKDYQEKLFIRFQLSDYVPQDNFYRQLKSILDLSFLYDSTSRYYGREGQKSIDPVVFMKLMLVGYLENLNSDRRIVATSRMRMDILYFLGYDLDEELPWHSTLSRTRQLFGEEEFTALFKLVLKKCIEKGLISGKRQAIDSAFVKANAAMSSVVKRQVMDDAAAYGKELDANKGDGENDIPQKTEVKKPKKNARLDNAVNNRCYSPSDPDARVSVKPGKITRLNYSAQVSVDTQNHVVTHIQAFHADKGDGQCLPEVLNNTIDNLKENGLEIAEILADAGYSSEAALQALEDNNIKGYIPNRAGNRTRDSREGFIYDRENDRYACPQGKYLTFRRLKKVETSTHKIYRTGVKDCRDCPFKDACANPAGVKEIKDSIIKDLYTQMHQRMQTREGKRARKTRQGTVEPVLGTLINFVGMKQLNTKGIKLANKCMIMAAVAYNLKKLVNGVSTRVRKRTFKTVKEVKTEINRLLSVLVLLVNLTMSNLFNHSEKQMAE